MSGQHHLARCVVVGDHQRGGPLRFGVEHSPDVLGAGGDRQHCAILTLAGLGHQHAAHACGVDEAVGRQDARRGQRADLAEAVPGCGIGPHAQDVEQRELGEAGGGDGRLGVVHRGECGALRLRRGGIERRFREHHPVQVGEVAVEGVPHRERAREGERKVGTHPDVLAALAGEEEGRLADASRTEANGDIGIGEALRGPADERAAQPFGERLQRRGVRCDQARAGGLRCVEVTCGLERDTRQAFPGAHRRQDLGGPRCKVCGGRRAEHHQFGGQGTQSLGALRAAVLLQRHVEVAAAETE